jgi:hypothetical protein
LPWQGASVIKTAYFAFDFQFCLSTKLKAPAISSGVSAPPDARNFFIKFKTY